jgi:hypothetical protein
MESPLAKTIQGQFSHNWGLEPRPTTDPPPPSAPVEWIYFIHHLLSFLRPLLVNSTSTSFPRGASRAYPLEAFEFPIPLGNGDAY